MTVGNLTYNALPYLYTISGTFTMLTLGETIGKFSGMLLISAAMLVFSMRLEHRTRRAHTAETHLEAHKRQLRLLREDSYQFQPETI